MDVHRPHRWRRRILTALGLLAVIGALGYTGYVGVVGSDTIIHPERSADCRTPLVRYGWPHEAINYDRAADDGLTPTQTPSDSGRLRWTCDGVPAPAGDMVTASDGTRIAGWYIPAASAIGPTGPTLVLVHGNSSNKSEYQRYAVPLHDEFNIVVMDLRNSGQSQVADTTLGVREQLDVRAMVDWLVETKQPTWIGLVGTSIGGAAVLAAAVGDERVDAVILDSTHARIGDAIGNLLAHDKGHPAWPGSLAILIGTRLRTGIDPGAADPVDHIGRLGTRPVLLVHGSADPYDPPAQSAERNLAAAQAAGVDATLRVCDGAGHDAVIDDCPVDWATWVRAFLEPLVPVAALP